MSSESPKLINTGGDQPPALADSVKIMDGIQHEWVGYELHTFSMQQPPVRNVTLPPPPNPNPITT